MSLSFSKEDVHKHLQDLGYSNISNEQLREFMTDLKRLIRYEEKQKRIEAHLKYARTQSRCDKSETTEKGHNHKNKENKDNQHVNRHRHISADSSYSTATSSEYDSNETPKKAKLTKKRPQSSHLRAQSAKQSFNGSEKNLKHQDDWNHKPSSLSLLNTQSLLKSKDDVRAQNVDDSTEVIHSYRKNETLGNSTTEEFQIQIKIPPIPSPKILKKSSQENKESRDKKPSSATGKVSRVEFDGGCWEMINQDAIQILPPKPKIPTKPTTSCIKPTFTEKQKKDLKRDPVRLHDYYKKQWEKFRLPGDDSHETKELRWAVREWMMGRKPPES